MTPQSLMDALDQELIVTHLGTIDSFNTPSDALNALLLYYQDLGAFFERQKCIDICTAIAEDTEDFDLANAANRCIQVIKEHRY